MTSTLNIGILVFREGLECLLVLAAIMAGLTGDRSAYRRPIVAGAVAGVGATALTWLIAVRVLTDLSANLPALDVQAATGLLAVIVLLVVMNWFFHKVYWTGWIALHTDRKRRLLGTAEQASPARLLLGFALLGFTSLYREGVEVVLFLQSYRLRLGAEAIRPGVWLGLALTVAVGVVTFVAERKLPYRRMLVVTGVLLGVVLLVMVGEQVQEMQLAGWLPTTVIPALEDRVPSWMGFWFSIFPTIETLPGQVLATALVLGSYVIARRRIDRGPVRDSSPARGRRTSERARA
jgi:high-affinity iron transporter